MRADLAKLLDSVCRRVKRVEIDVRLAQSVRAVVTSDRIGDAETTLTRYAEHPSEALQQALLDTAGWINGQHHRTGERIDTAYALPQLELAAALNACASLLEARGLIDQLSNVELQAVHDARRALARWGEP